MREANAIRVEARFLHTNELIKAIIVKTNREIISFMRENISHPNDYKYIKFIVRHINMHDYILSLKRKQRNEQ